MRKAERTNHLMQPTVGIWIFCLSILLYIVQIVLTIINDFFPSGEIKNILNIPVIPILSSMLSVVVEFIMLLRVCHRMGYLWANTEVSFTEFKKAETILTIIRGTIYIDVILSIFLSLIDSLEQSSFFDWHVSGLLVVFTISVGQSLFRATFRRWPNYCIAIGDALMVMSVLLIIHEWVFMEEFTHNITHIFSIAETDIIVIVMIFIASILFVNPFSESKKQIAVDNLDSSHRSRRRLLAHFNYKLNSALQSHENIVTVIIGLHAIVYFIAFSFISAYEVHSGNRFGDTSPSLYLFFLAMLLCVIGIYSHWQVSAERLQQSEYYYILIHAIHLKPADVLNSTARWKDYCQVIINIYAASTGITSENSGFHNLHLVLRKLRDYLSISNSEIVYRFNKDLLVAMNNRWATTNESLHCSWHEWETIFANEYSKLICPSTDRNRTTYLMLMCENPFDLVLHAEKCFSSKKEFWAGHRRVEFHESTTDYLVLSKLDVIKYYFGSDKIERGEILHYVPPNSEIKKEEKIHRLEVLLLYPFLLRESYIERFGKPFMSKKNFYVFTKRYYKKIIDHSMKAILPIELSVALCGTKKFFGEKYRNDYKRMCDLVWHCYRKPVIRNKHHITVRYKDKVNC